jgi:hypothetical protein
VWRLMSFACAVLQRGAAALVDVRAHGGGRVGDVAEPRLDTVAAGARRARSPPKVLRGARQLHSFPSATGFAGATLHCGPATSCLFRAVCLAMNRVTRVQCCPLRQF